MHLFACAAGKEMRSGDRNGCAEVENSSFNTSALHRWRIRKAVWFYTVLLVHLQHWQQHWQQSSIKVWLQTKLLYSMKFLLLLNYSCRCSHEAVPVGSIFTPPPRLCWQLWWVSKVLPGMSMDNPETDGGSCFTCKSAQAGPELCFNTSISELLLLAGRRWCLRLPPTVQRHLGRGEFKLILGINLRGKVLFVFVCWWHVQGLSPSQAPCNSWHC